LTIKSSSTIPADDLFGRAFMLYGSADNQNDQDLSEMGVPNVKMIVHL